MVNIGSDRRCLARHGEIIRYNNNYPPTPGPHLMKTDSDDRKGTLRKGRLTHV